jgi:hypothetical protein
LRQESSERGKRSTVNMDQEGAENPLYTATIYSSISLNCGTILASKFRRGQNPIFPHFANRLQCQSAGQMKGLAQQYQKLLQIGVTEPNQSAGKANPFFGKSSKLPA